MAELNFFLQSTGLLHNDRPSQMAYYHAAQRTNHAIVLEERIAGAVSRVVEQCRAGHHSIRNLHVQGHGTPDGQQFDEHQEDLLIASDMAVGSPLRGMARELVRLQPHFTRDGDGVLVLGGCRIAQSPSSQKNVALQLSRVMPGVVVTAFDMAQVPTWGGKAGLQSFYRNGMLVRQKFHWTYTTFMSIAQTLIQTSAEDPDPDAATAVRPIPHF